MRVRKETPRHFGKRALALFLSLVMCISMVQISAFAAAPQMTKAEQAALQIEGVKDTANGGADEWAPDYYTYNVNQQKFTTKDYEAQVNSPDAATDAEHKVEVSKTIEATGTENLFDITLQVRTKQDISTTSKSPDSAVTLVIDVSGSMENCAECGEKKDSNVHKTHTVWKCPIGEGTYEKGQSGKCKNCGKYGYEHQEATVAECTYESRLAAAKRTAIQFLTDYAKSANGAHRYVSIVKFSTGAYEVSGWKDAAKANDLAALKAAINSNDLKAGGGTNIDAGLRVAYAHLNQSKVTGIDYRYCILLTDGEPTYYYNTEFTTGSSATSYDPGDTINKNDGWNYWYKNLGGKGDSSSSDKNCAGYAETVAAAIKGMKSTTSLQRNVTLYSVYYGQSGDKLTNSSGSKQKIQSWLTDISSTEAFLAGNTSGLLESFQSILNTIIMMANAWIVTDPMGDYITLEENSAVNSGIVTKTLDGTHEKEYNSAADKRELTWRLPLALPDGPDAQGWRTYTMTYRVRLNTDADGFSFNQFYQTNGDTTLEYNFTATDKESGETYLVTEKGERVYKEGTLTLNEGIDAKWKKNQILHFKVPAVQGVKADFSFTKTGYDGNVIATYTQPAAGTALTEENAAFKMVSENGKTYLGYAAGGTVYFTNIPSGYTYTLSEVTPPDGYLKSNETVAVEIGGGRIYIADSETPWDGQSTSYEFPNELDPKPVDLTFTKHWLGGAGNKDVTIHVDAVYTDGTDANDYDLDVTLTKDGGWTTTVENVPTVDVSNGKTIRYLSDNASEADMTGYAQVGEISGGWNGQTGTYDTFEVTNSKTTGITITKTWVGLHTGIDSVTVAVFNGSEKVWQGSVTDTVTLNLPAYDRNGSQITYSVMEVDAAGNLYGSGDEITLGTGDNEKTYTVSISDFDITNTIKQDYKDITVNKTWKVGDSTTAGSYTATFELYADGSPAERKTISNPVTSAVFENKPVYDLSSGDEITYTVKEVSATGTDVVMDTTEKTVTDGSVSFTNTREKTQTVQVTKVWDDDSNEYGTRPDSVRLVVSAGGKYSYTVDFDSSDYYQLDSVTDTVKVPLYDDNGNELNYSVTEANLDSNNKLAGKDGSLYTPAYAGNITDGFTVTNTLGGEETTIQVQKIWVDTLTDAQRKEARISTTIKLMKGDEVVDEWTTSANDTHSFPVFNYNGATYTVVETAVDGYNGGQAAEAVLKDGVYVFTNVIDQDNTVEVKGTKTWDGGDSAYRPDVTFTLYAGGVATAHTKTLADVAADGSFSFTGLPKYAIDGTSCTEIQYTIQEAMSGSMAAYYKADSTAPDADANGVFNFVNRFNPGTITVGGTKTWVDGGADHTDTTITVGLYVGNQQKGDPQTVRQVNGAFTYSFPSLDKVDAQGNTIEYAIYELDANGAPVGMGTANRSDSVKDGEITIDGQVYSVYYQGNNIVNKRETGTVSVGVTKVWNGPKTDITFDIFRDNETTACESMTLTAADADASVESGNTWKKNISLPKYNDDGAEITYRVEERGADNGTVTLDGHTYDVSRVEGTNIFTNRVQQEYNVSVKLTKAWADTDLAVSELPESIEVYLLRDGVAYDADSDGEAEVYVLTSANDWTLTINELPRFQNDGSESAYSVQEVDYDQASGTVKHGSDYYKAEVARDTDSTDANFDLTLTNTCLGHYAYIINRHYTYTDSSAEMTEWVESTGVTYGSKDEQVSYNAGDYVKPATKHTDITFGFDGGTEKNEQHTTITIAAGDVTDKVMTLDNMDLFIVDLYYSKTETYVPPVNPPKDDGRKPSKPPVVIEEPEVPLTPMPEEPEIEIPEEEVPLADIPETGDVSALWLALTALSGTGLAGLAVLGRKKREDEE